MLSFNMEWYQSYVMKTRQRKTSLVIWNLIFVAFFLSI